MGQLDGSEIVYVGRVAVPKIITIAVGVGTRLPAASTSMGRVLLAALTPAGRRAALAAPVRGEIRAVAVPSAASHDVLLAQVREQGWAAVDQQLAAGVRSVAVPLRDHEERTVAAVNICVHAAEHTMEALEGEPPPAAARDRRRDRERPRRAPPDPARGRRVNAAILHEHGATPRFGSFAAPEAAPGRVVVDMAPRLHHLGLAWKRQRTGAEAQSRCSYRRWKGAADVPG